MNKISKEDGKTIMSLALDAVLREAMKTTTPTDWVKAVAGKKDTLPVTLQFPQKFITEMLGRPGGESALNLFVNFAIAFYITAKAEEVAEGLLDTLTDKIKEVTKRVEGPPTTHESQSTQGLTQELMKRIVVN